MYIDLVPNTCFPIARFETYNHTNRLSVESYSDLEANLKVILNGDEQVVDSRCSRCVYFSSWCNLVFDDI